VGALSRVQRLQDLALSAFILQVLSEAVSQFASETAEGFEKQSAVLKVWSIGRKGVLLSSLPIPDEKGQQVAQHCDHGCGRFHHKQVELVGIKPVLLFGVVSRNAGQSGAGPLGLWCDRCRTARAQTTCTSAAGQGCRSRSTFGLAVRSFEGDKRG
jgi:hypothetical protein